MYALSGAAFLQLSELKGRRLGAPSFLAVLGRGLVCRGLSLGFQLIAGTPVNIKIVSRLPTVLRQQYGYAYQLAIG